MSSVSILAEKLSLRHRRLRGSRTLERDDPYPGLKQSRRPGLVVSRGRMASIHELRHRLPRRAGSRAAWCRWRASALTFAYLTSVGGGVAAPGHQHWRPGAVFGVVGERRAGVGAASRRRRPVRTGRPPAGSSAVPVRAGQDRLRAALHQGHRATRLRQARRPDRRHLRPRTRRSRLSQRSPDRDGGAPCIQRVRGRAARAACPPGGGTVP